MTWDDLKDFIEKKVRVVDIDDSVFEGIFTNTEPFTETSSGEDEIEIYTGVVYVGIEFSAIKSIEEIE